MGMLMRRRELLGGVIDLAEAVIGTISAVTYNGSAHTPTPTVTYKGKTLAAGTDFTFSYSNNINAGNATCTINAVAKKSKGTKSANFVINKAAGSSSIDKSSITITGSGSIETITVTRLGDGLITASSSNTSIATVSVSGNIVTVTSVAIGSATVTVSVAAGTNYTAPSNKSCSVSVVAAYTLTSTVGQWTYFGTEHNDYIQYGSQKYTLADNATKAMSFSIPAGATINWNLYAKATRGDGRTAFSSQAQIYINGVYDHWSTEADGFITTSNTYDGTYSSAYGTFTPTGNAKFYLKWVSASTMR